LNAKSFNAPKTKNMRAVAKNRSGLSLPIIRGVSESRNMASSNTAASVRKIFTRRSTRQPNSGAAVPASVLMADVAL